MPGAKDQFNENGIIGYTNNGSQTVDSFVDNVIKYHAKHLYGDGLQSVLVDPEFNPEIPYKVYKKFDYNSSNMRSITTGKSWDYFGTKDIKANNITNWGINQYLISGGTNFENKTKIQHEINNRITDQLGKITALLSLAAQVTPQVSEPDGFNQSASSSVQRTGSPTDIPRFSFLGPSLVLQTKIEVLQGFFDDFNRLYPELEKSVDEIQKILQDNHRPVASLSLAANGLVAEVFSDPNKVIADRRALSPEARFYMLPGVPLSFADPNMPGWLDNPKQGLFPAHNNIPTIGFRTYTDKSDIKFSDTAYFTGTPYDGADHIPKVMESFLASTPENMILSLDKHQSNIGNYSASIMLNYDLGYESGEFHGYNPSRSCTPEVVLHCKQADAGIGGTVRVTHNEIELIGNKIDILAQETPDRREGGFLHINKDQTKLANIASSGISGIIMENGNVNIIAKSEIKFITESFSEVFHASERRVSLSDAVLQIIPHTPRPECSPINKLYSEHVTILQQCQLQRERIRAKIMEAKSSYQMFDKGFIVETEKPTSHASSSSFLSPRQSNNGSGSSSSSSPDSSNLVEMFGEAPPPPPPPSTRRSSAPIHIPTQSSRDPINPSAPVDVLDRLFDEPNIFD